MGVGNKKVQGPATYRPLPETCAPECPYLSICYAEGGNVVIHARRARSSTVDSLFAVTIAVAAVEVMNAPIRLHVSGDFYSDGELDEEYLHGLCVLGFETQHTVRSRPWAWTYTHAPPEIFDDWREELRMAGIEILYSDRFEPGGAVIWPHDMFPVLQNDRKLKFVKCLEQVNGTPCIVCDLCRNARSKNQCIVFEPNRARYKEVMKKATAIASQNQRLVRNILRKHYGVTRLGNPEDPLDALIFNLLSARAKQGNATRALNRLKKLTWRRVYRQSYARTKDALNAVGYNYDRLEQIKTVLERVRGDMGEWKLDKLASKPDDELLIYLQSLPHVGPTIARSVALFGFDRQVFPVSAPVWGSAVSLQWAEQPFHAKKALALERKIEPEFRKVLHVLLHQHGTGLCKNRMRCRECPLLELCPSARR
jgi:endonuclease III